MRRYFFVPALLAAIAIPTICAHADPFNGTHVVPADAGNMFLMPGSWVAQLAYIQMQLNDVISREFHAVHGAGSIAAALTILALAFVYGIVHAAVPGHGKTVVGSYFVANEGRWHSGLFMGGLISLIKGVTAIAIVFLMSLVLHLKEMEMANQGAVIGSVSYALVVVIGCVVFWRAATGRGCGQSHDAASHHACGAMHDHSHPEMAARAARDMTFQRILIAVTGIVPCSSAIVIMLFALANNVMAIGIAAVAAQSLGMAVTVSAVGMVGIIARPVLFRVAEGRGHHFERAERTVKLLGATAMVGFAGLLMIGALSRISLGAG